jgi:AAA15 family ATPase/GTPase
VAKSNFGDIIKSGKKSEIIAALKLMEPQISGLELIEDVVYLQNENSHMLPLSVFGDGLKKIMALAAGVIRAKDGILLVDELETAIHTSVLKEVFSWLVGACREFNVQLFFTTHSIETVDAVLNCGAQVIREDLLRVITLVKKENKTVARVLSGEKALQVRGDYDMELRK